MTTWACQMYTCYAYLACDWFTVCRFSFLAFLLEERRHLGHVTDPWPQSRAGRLKDWIVIGNSKAWFKMDVEKPEANIYTTSHWMNYFGPGFPKKKEASSTFSNYNHWVALLLFSNPVEFVAIIFFKHSTRQLTEVKPTTEAKRIQGG